MKDQKGIKVEREHTVVTTTTTTTIYNTQKAKERKNKKL